MTSILIAYFSRRGENYVGGRVQNLAVGNAETIATFAQEHTGADLFPIETVKSYPVDYYECIEEAQREKDAQARPELSRYLDSLDGYDTVILVYPNWWGALPMAVYSFIERLDWAGKTLLPICTHEGSGLSKTERDLKQACTGATVTKGLAIAGADAPNCQTELNRWLDAQLS